MTVNNIPVEEYPLPKSTLRISTTDAYDFEDARVAAGITVSEFESFPGDPCWIVPDGPYISKAEVVIFHRNRRLIDAILNYEQYRKK